MVVVAADLARRRQARGLKLNYPEAMSIITYEIMEGARDGRTVAELMSFGTTVLTARDVMDGVADMIHEVQVEATFPGRHQIGYRPQSHTMKPGEIIPVNGSDLEINPGLSIRTISVANTGDRPIQVGSHFHFFEVNESLIFDRDDARGFRLNIPAGTAVRFEPGDRRSVDLVALAGNRMVYGLNSKINGALDKS